MAQTKPHTTENTLQLVINPDQSMTINRITIVNGFVTKRENWIQDMADIAIARLEQHIRHARLSGGQI